MFMLIVAFGIYLITPDFIQAWLMSKRPEFLSIPIYTTSLSVLSAFVICEVVEFFFRHITADKGEASNAEIAACCLWHTSFYGYLPYQREETFDDLFDGIVKKGAFMLEL